VKPEICPKNVIRGIPHVQFKKPKSNTVGFISHNIPSGNQTKQLKAPQWKIYFPSYKLPSSLKVVPTNVKFVGLEPTLTIECYRYIYHNSELFKKVINQLCYHKSPVCTYKSQCLMVKNTN
jgi:hypothetical protein